MGFPTLNGGKSCTVPAGSKYEIFRWFYCRERPGGGQLLNPPPPFTGMSVTAMATEPTARVLVVIIIVFIMAAVIIVAILSTLAGVGHRPPAPLTATASDVDSSAVTTATRLSDRTAGDPGRPRRVPPRR